MTNEEIEPLVPVMPRRTSNDAADAASAGAAFDGGRPRRYDDEEEDAPLVPEV